MPTYYFTCPACGNKEQTEQPIKEDIKNPTCTCGYVMDQQLFAPHLNITHAE